MNGEMKTCKSCKADFTIRPEDFTFYEKMKVPPPTWCPECRNQRRMMWRNERSLYKRECGLTGKNVISGFSNESGVIVYDNKQWFSDVWDPMDYGVPYDFSRSFFVQFNDLMRRVPMPATFAGNSVGSDYCNHIGEAKNSYLAFGSWDVENVLYGNKVIASKDSYDILASSHCEFSYGIIQSQHIYNCSSVQKCDNCNHSVLLYDCRGCSDCFGCVGLRNKQYHIFNRPYPKEEYVRKLKEMDIGSYQNLKKVLQEFHTLKQNSIHKFAHFTNAQHFSGDNLSGVSSCHYCFDLADDVRDSKFCINGGVKMTDSYDGYGVGMASLLYEAVDTGLNGSRMLFDIVVWEGSDALYSYNCKNVKDVFGCIGLRNKQYCILNKQYSKEEYEALVPKIIEHMNTMPYVDGKGREYRYGEFFPPELSPFAYNETIAQEYFPMTKEEALAKGYKWRDPDTKAYAVTIKPDDLPDHIKDVPDSITSEVIGCEHKGSCNHQCTTAFKVIPAELQFYRQMNLPLPRLCPNCRHYERLKQRNPLKLWHRQCQCAGSKSSNGIYRNTVQHIHGSEQCPTEFETSYAPDRPEIVYCESCYNAEVV